MGCRELLERGGIEEGQKGGGSALSSCPLGEKEKGRKEVFGSGKRGSLAVCI